MSEKIKDGVFEIPLNFCIVCGCFFDTRVDHIADDRKECRRNLYEGTFAATFGKKPYSKGD